MCARARACLCVGVWRSEAGGCVEKGKKRRDGDAGVEKEKSGGGEELYSEEVVERKEALWNGRSLGLAKG